MRSTCSTARGEVHLQSSSFFDMICIDEKRLFHIRFLSIIIPELMAMQMESHHQHTAQHTPVWKKECRLLDCCNWWGALFSIFWARRVLVHFFFLLCCRVHVCVCFSVSFSKCWQIEKEEETATPSVKRRTGGVSYFSTCYSAERKERKVTMISVSPY